MAMPAMSFWDGGGGGGVGISGGWRLRLKRLGPGWECLTGPDCLPRCWWVDEGWLSVEGLVKRGCMKRTLAFQRALGAMCLVLVLVLQAWVPWNIR